MAERKIIADVTVAPGEANIVLQLIGSQYSALRYSGPALEEIRRHAVDKFLSIPRGGLEVGGLLLGRVAENVIEIHGTEEFSLEYSSGPSYRLSSGDEQALTTRLQQTSDVIGWWHSHTRSEADLSDEDLRVHRAFFSDPHAVALIIKPFKFDPAQVAVYVPCASDDPQLPCARFTLDSPDALPRENDRPRSPEPKALAPVVVPMVRRPGPTTSTRAVPRGVAGLIAAAAFGAIAWFAASSPTASRRAEPFALSLSDTANQLTVHWDRNASAIQSSIGGELTVVDGQHVTRIPLGVDSLNSGTLAYVRRTGKVEVRLRTTSRENQLREAVAHFVGPSPEPVTVVRREEPKVDPDVERMRAEVDRLNGELTRMRSAPTPAIAKRTVVPPPKAAAVKLVQLATTTPAVQRPQTQQPQPPATTIAAAPPQLSVPISQPTLPSAAPVSQPITAAAPPPAQVAASKPLSNGKAIWTGTLPRGGVLMVDGRRPSVGALTGRMPDGPSRMRIYPADLRESGIVVYTQADKERIETPSAANGWNLTTYRPDAKRGRDVTVLESPSAANSWQRILVRSEQRPLSMLVLEWEEVR